MQNHGTQLWAPLPCANMCTINCTMHQVAWLPLLPGGAFRAPAWLSKATQTLMPAHVYESKPVFLIICRLLPNSHTRSPSLQIFKGDTGTALDLTISIFDCVCCTNVYSRSSDLQKVHRDSKLRGGVGIMVWNFGSRVVAGSQLVADFLGASRAMWSSLMEIHSLLQE